MITEKISLVSPGDLPGRILESVEEAQTFAAIQGYRGNGHRVNQTANAINLADALQIREGGNWGVEARAILRGGASGSSGSSGGLRRVGATDEAA